MSPSAHPSWGFPPTVWRGEARTPPAPSPPGLWLRRAAHALALTAVVAALAAAAEIRRFQLLLEGRTHVLSGTAVFTSDVLVAATGLLLVTCVLGAAVITGVALIRTHRWAAIRIGRTPSRSSPAIAALLFVPGWNIYGAGQVIMEIEMALRRAEPVGGTMPAPRTGAPLVSVWWIAWVGNWLLFLLTLARGLAGDLQAVADTVELHIALDLMAAVVAGLGAVVVLRFRRLVAGRGGRRSAWVVQPPPPTRPISRPTHDPSPADGTAGQATGDPSATVTR